MSETGASQTQTNAQILTTEVVQAAEILAAFFVPGGKAIALGMTAEQIGNVVIGASGLVGPFTDAFNAAKDMVAGGTPPTADQLLADFKTASAANDALAKADADVMAGRKPE